MAFNEDSKSRQEEMTRLMQEGRRPDDAEGRADLFRDKLAGNVPLGVDAPNKTSRKVIGGGGHLLAVLRHGLFGLLAVVFGARFIWAGTSERFDGKTTGIGVAVLLVGVFLLTRAFRAWQNLRAIVRA
jgi:hypothetical protein